MTNFVTRLSPDGSTTAKEGIEMKNFSLATIGSAVVAALAAAVIGLAAPVAAAPTGDANAQDTIARLTSEGYTVIVNRFGNAPLDQAEVVSIRPGTTYQRIDAGAPVLGSTDNFVRLQERTVYVDVR
ncbi:hypothetical protein [Mycolicibacterium pulveris]|uniref:hypothetical protein n=1 Tax=Mycolicibacterium pulveris TaxID=36813 RepID=UPI003CF3E961